MLGSRSLALGRVAGHVLGGSGRVCLLRGAAAGRSFVPLSPLPPSPTMQILPATSAAPKYKFVMPTEVPEQGGGVGKVRRGHCCVAAAEPAHLTWQEQRKARRSPPGDLRHLPAVCHEAHEPPD